MHELALMESMVGAIEDRCGDQRVVIVRIELGALAGVAIDALRFAFDACTERTPLEGATLEILEIPARARCRVCLTESAITSYALPCACGSFDREVLTGEEIRIKEVEVM